MRHARTEDLDQIKPLLRRLRELPQLTEKSRGIFYRGSRAFLHFHEHEGVLYADIRLGDDFERFPATTAPQMRSVLAIVRSALRTSSSAAAKR